MRFVVIIAALVCAASAARAEDTRESRYGPTALRPSVSLAGSRYSGPILGWAGKQEIAPQAKSPAPELRPMATPWRQLGAVPQPQPQQPAQQAYAAPRQTMASAPMQAPPQFPQASAPAAVASARSQVQTPIAYAAPPQFPSPALNALPGQPQGARTYSVGRQYGMTPDAIPPAPPNGMVFIAPSDEPAPSKKTEEPRHGSVEWLAQAPMDPPDGDDAKKSGDN